MFVALGIVSALFEAQRSGCGQVIDGAMIDGVASLTAATMGMLATGQWGGRANNVLDGGAPYYRTYATRDGGFVAVGAIEPQFYSELLGGLGLSVSDWPQNDRAVWPALTQELARLFASEDRSTWEQRFANSDACVTPVLSFEEAPDHPHHRARGTYVDIGGVLQPAPGPRLGQCTPLPIGAPPEVGADTDAILRALGRAPAEIAQIRSRRVVA